MTNLPLPTDNLYKFVALSGLTILLFSVVYPIRTVMDLELQIARAEVQISQTTGGIQDVETALSDIKHQDSPSAVRLNEIVEKHEASKARQLNDEVLAAEIRVRLNHLHFMRLVSLLGIVLGGSLSMLGFILWYIVVQRPADLIAARQAKGNGT